MSSFRGSPETGQAPGWAGEGEEGSTEMPGGTGVYSHFLHPAWWSRSLWSCSCPPPPPHLIAQLPSDQPLWHQPLPAASESLGEQTGSVHLASVPLLTQFSHLQDWVAFPHCCRSVLQSPPPNKRLSHSSWLPFSISRACTRQVTRAHHRLGTVLTTLNRLV